MLQITVRLYQLVNFLESHTKEIAGKKRHKTCTDLLLIQRFSREKPNKKHLFEDLVFQKANAKKR